ncbi:MAG: Hpt domain-containing protein [Lachnospiraceae bacterium]|nr:Hpt domain-containing protein [Lachnospiraceae bacterium]
MRENRIDRETGIMYCGTEELYEEIVSDFYKLIDEKASKIEELLREGNIRDYTVEVHSLKSTARMIGASDLSAAALEMEMAGKDNDTAKLQEKTPELLAMYREFKDVLGYIGEQKAAADKEEVSTDLIREKLETIIRGTEDFDIDTVDQAMKELNGFKMPSAAISEMMNRLDLFVRDVALDDISNTAASILELL